MLENKADWFNQIMHRPTELNTMSIVDGRKKWKGNIGHYHISYQNGGVCLHEIVSEGGGVRCPVGSYHRPKRELLEAMDNYMEGISDVGRDRDLFRR